MHNCMDTPTDRQMSFSHFSHFWFATSGLTLFLFLMSDRILAIIAGFRNLIREIKIVQ